MNEELLIFIEKQIVGRIKSGLGSVKVFNLADAAEEEGALVQNANAVVRLESWDLEHESNSLVVTHSLNYLITVVVTSLQTHYDALRVVTKITNSLFKWSPKLLQPKLGRVNIVGPIELTKVNFKGVTEAQQYVYDLSLKLILRQTYGVAFRDYCVDIGQCSPVNWPNINRPCCIGNEELGTLPDGSIVLLKDFPKARPGVPYPDVVISLGNRATMEDL